MQLLLGDIQLLRRRVRGIGFAHDNIKDKAGAWIDERMRDRLLAAADQADVDALDSNKRVNYEADAARFREKARTAY